MRSRPGYHMTNEIRILVADDFEDWRVRIRQLLSFRPSWRIVAEAPDGLEAVQKAAELRPDVVLLDVQMPGLNGIEAARKIRQDCPGSRIIFLSQSSDKEIIRAALEIGAKAFVQKAMAARELIPAIEAALRDDH
jgi:DNA-binding NarL/FixJ family response regulator